MAGFVENVNKVALGLTDEFIQNINTAVAIPNMTVTVTELPAGSAPTSSWNGATSVLSLGIPAGDTGVSIQSIVKTSTTGNVDTYTVTLTDTSTTTFTVTNGESAYELALASGFVGTQAEWLASLVGPEGPQGIQGIQGIQGLQGLAGADGSSAYELAVAGGFTGTEAEWLASLEGPQGPQGIQGEAGPQGVQGIQGIQGPAGVDGADGVGISSVVLTSTVGLVKTYTITFTDATTTTFDVHDGANGQSVHHVTRTAGTGAAGTTDTYTVYGDVGETVNLGTFNVYNGADGLGSGDMLKSVYDTTNNGKVDVAEAAESVPWSGVTGAPATYPPSAHNHDDLYFTEAETTALVNGLIDDTIPLTTKTYSSAKTQDLHNAQAIAIANLSGASATFYNNVSVVVPEVPAAFTDLTWTNNQASSNSNVFELGTNEINFYKDGNYSFLNTLTYYRLSDGSNIDVTFELYDADTSTVLATYVQPIDMIAGTKETIPMNVVLAITGASDVNPVRMKVRMRASSANGTLELFSFNSILVAQSVVDVADLETDPVFTAWDKSTGISITKSQVSDFPTDITTQGNVFNGASQLVQLDATGKLPAIDGSQLLGVSTGGTMLTKTQPANASDDTTINLFYRDENIVDDILLTYKPFVSNVNTFCNFSASSKYALVNIYEAFNDNTAGWITSGGQGNEWIAIQYNTGAQTINSYQIMPWSVDNFPSRSPKDWYFQGSNDGTNWTTIDTVTGYTTYTSNTYTQEFVISNPASYTHYRLYVLANVGNVAYTGISSLKLNGYTPLGKVIKCIDNVGTVSDVMGEALPHNHTGVYEPANANIQGHIGSTSNPHSVTADQVGAYTKAEVDTALDGYSLTSHAHTGMYEPADATILKDADIGVTVQPYNANTTTAGNTFNGANQLVKLDATGKLPAIDGSQLTGVSTVTDLDGLSDVVVSTPTTGQVLKYNGTNWVNGADNDTIYTHPTGDGNLHVPATGTTNAGKVLTAGATAGSLSWETPAVSGGISSFASIWKFS